MKAICINAHGARQLCEGEYYDIQPCTHFAEGVDVCHDGEMIGSFLASRFEVVDTPKTTTGRTKPCCGGLVPPGQYCKYHGS